MALLVSNSLVMSLSLSETKPNKKKGCHSCLSHLSQFTSHDVAWTSHTSILQDNLRYRFRCFLFYDNNFGTFWPYCNGAVLKKKKAETTREYRCYWCKILESHDKHLTQPQRRQVSNEISVMVSNIVSITTYSRVYFPNNNKKTC